MQPASDLIFRLCSRNEWAEADKAGFYAGAAHDVRDGFIHFSGPNEIVESAARHHPGATDLVLLAIDAAMLGGGLRWEPSRGGVLFPHLYGGPLPVSAVRWVKALPLGPDGTHLFPPLDGTPA